ncbi:hypothetical protein RMATCC62417_10380 [Rhizopus microsporus]|nr:hypothetical protein RMATCC62417_10380 [Rhizopus microsporus]
MTSARLELATACVLDRRDNHLHQEVTFLSYFETFNRLSHRIKVLPSRDFPKEEYYDSIDSKDVPVKIQSTTPKAYQDLQASSGTKISGIRSTISTSQDLDLESSAKVDQSTSGNIHPPIQTHPSVSVNTPTPPLSLTPSKRPFSVRTPPLVPADIRTSPAPGIITSVMSQQPPAHNFSVNTTGPFNFGVASAPPTSQVILDSVKETTPLPTSSQAPTFDPAVPTPDWVSIFQAQFRRYDERLAQFEHLLEENLRLRAALEAAQQRIAALEADRAVHPKPTSTPPAPTMLKLSEGTSASRWSPPEAAPLPATATKSFAAVVAATATPSAQTKASLPVRRRRVTPRQMKAVARTFAPPAGDHGYQYVYLPCRFREAYSSLRAKPVF